MRVLAWDGDILYVSLGYELLRAQITQEQIVWQVVGRYVPSWLRSLSSRFTLSSRLLRDGFHALAVLSSGDIVAAIPGQIIRLAPGQSEFQAVHRIVRGSRPLHFAVSAGDRIYWGEYFDNRQRDEVHIYASTDRGRSWNVAYTFARGAIRHVHNVVYDRWADCLWVLTGDEDAECRLLRASCDFKTVETALSGTQQTRAAALIPAAEGIYFSSDTPVEANYVYRLDRRGRLSRLAGLSSSSIYGCRVGPDLFFSTMVEPSSANSDCHARVYGASDDCNWQSLLEWKKDKWPMGLFQYGNVIFPNGENRSGILALTSVAVTPGDQETSLWRVEHQ
ncbi:MAG TPA: hypothetical protein VLW84_08665 [Terriglobales bacterium]|nr:hypothetical protein [Terriglobales bacterium]